MDNYVITISRGYGSGGRKIGILLSEMLGIPYYDRDIIRMASDDSGINEALFAKSDEKVKTSARLRSAGGPNFSGALITPDSPNFVSDANLYNYQARVIRKLAETESCIIIGRAADYLLQDSPNAIHVNIQADFEDCVKAVMVEMNMTEKDAQRTVRRTDKARADFYYYYTGRRWDDELNYDLTLNTSRMSRELCAKTIIAYLKLKFGVVVQG
jgi:hypothetical protein